MTDLHQTRTPNTNAGIDAMGWLFWAAASAIIAVAAVIGSGTLRNLLDEAHTIGGRTQ